MPGPASGLGLYYPYFHVRDERWLKMSALYWPAIVRIVPEDYAVRDSRTVRVLADQAGFIENVDPAVAVDAIAPRFLELLTGHEDALRSGLRVQQRDMAAFDHSASGTSAAAPHRPRLAALHESQVRPDLTRALVEAGLAVRGRLTLSQEVDARWLVLRERFVSLYMSCLAEEFGSANHLELTTDQPHAFALANGWSADLLAGYLLRTPAHAATKAAAAQAGPSLAERIGILALGLVVPADIDRVSAEQIVRLRRRHGREFLAFRQAVGQAAAELASLADIPDGRTLDAYLRNEVNDRFAIPLDELRQCLAGMNLGAATAAVNVKTQLPSSVTLAGGAWLAGQPLVAGAVAAGFGLLAIGHTSRQARGTALAAAGPAAYLLHTGNALSQRRLLSRTLDRMTGIAGPAARG
ncbi:DUF6236 family protein [Streptomyces lushanensis]|uniref:DUF6236 family protein n=1 Tax=Streptomyces lushanensis TaxID=1434255 RepID=UPI00114CFFE1|nr:DUF6236 family protein [Streptomyces lushanensis]